MTLPPYIPGTFFALTTFVVASLPSDELFLAYHKEIVASLFAAIVGLFVYNRLCWAKWEKQRNELFERMTEGSVAIEKLADCPAKKCPWIEEDHLPVTL
jgi:hypothetical protein